MENFKLPSLRIAFATLILLCFGFITLVPAANAAAAEPAPLTGASIAAQGDKALTAQATHKVKVKINKTKMYVGVRPSVTGVTVDGKSVSTKYFDFNGVIPTDVGEGYIKATGKSGTKFEGLRGTTYFRVIPRGTSLSSLEPVIGGFKASWSSQTSYTTGYQLQYSRSINFKSSKKITISDKYDTSKKITDLKEGVTYYVRVRTYASTVDGKMYSPWSSHWSVTTKATERSPYEPTQKLKISTISRLDNWCYVKWSKAKKWYNYTGSASSKVSGYELQWDDNKNFKSPRKWTAKSQESYSHTIDTLTPSKTYYFRARLWNTVKAKTYYGPWSAIKSTASASEPVG